MLTILLTSVIDSGTSDAAKLESLIGRMAKGDLSALATLYDATQTAVYAFALSLLRHREDAEDVRQDCYLALYGSAATYRPLGKPMAWIMTVARNLCLQRLRVRQRQAEYKEGDIAENLPDLVMAMEDRVVLRVCLGQLSEEEQQIIVLYAIGGLRHREIAEALDLPLSTVLSKYRRALKKLHRTLE